MPTQVQIRGAVEATQEARTLVSRELDVNTTDTRLAVHNGSTAGGIRHLNSFDSQNQEFTFANATGTNALTITLAVAPTSYQNGQRFVFKTANTNTGSVTLNVNSLGAQTLKKIEGGALVNLVSGDLIAGQVVIVVYDGTDFQIIAGAGSSGSTTSWTPALDNVAITYTAQTGNVFQIGDWLFCDFRVTWSFIQNTETNFIRISGVPENITDYSLSGTAFHPQTIPGNNFETRLIACTENLATVNFCRTFGGGSGLVTYNQYFANSGTGAFEGNFSYRKA